MSKRIDSDRFNPTEVNVLELLRRSATARALASCFAAPGDGFPQRVVERLEALDRADGSLGEHLERVLQEWGGRAGEELSAEYSRLFFGTTPCPPYETAYLARRRLVSSVELADIQGFYRAFGFELAGRGRELPDHLCAQLEFHSVLLLKLAFARMQGWTEQAEVTEKALKAFLEAHLGRWVAAFAERLGGEKAASPYRSAAEACLGYLEEECRLLGAEPDPLPAEEGREVTSRESDLFGCPHAAVCGVPGAPPSTPDHPAPPTRRPAGKGVPAGPQLSSRSSFSTRVSCSGF